jgi:hypothetical protein
MNKIKILCLPLIATITFMVSGAVAHAEVLAPKLFRVSAAACTTAKECLNQGKSGEIMNALSIILNVLSGFVGLAAVIMLIVAGIQYSASNGDAAGVKAAKTKIGNVLLGLVAYIFLYAFLQWLIPGGIL